MTIRLFPNLKREELTEEKNNNHHYESYTGIVIDPVHNQFKIITGPYLDKKDMYRKLTKKGFIVRKSFETNVWNWMEENAPSNLVAYMMFSTAFSKWKNNNVLGKYYDKLLHDIPQLNREKEKGNPNSVDDKFIKLKKESVLEEDTDTQNRIIETFKKILGIKDLRSWVNNLKEKDVDISEYINFLKDELYNKYDKNLSNFGDDGVHVRDINNAKKTFFQDIINAYEDKFVPMYSERNAENVKKITIKAYGVSEDNKLSEEPVLFDSYYVRANANYFKDGKVKDVKLLLNNPSLLTDLYNIVNKDDNPKYFYFTDPFKTISVDVYESSVTARDTMKMDQEKSKDHIMQKLNTDPLILNKEDIVTLINNSDFSNSLNNSSEGIDLEYQLDNLNDKLESGKISQEDYDYAVNRINKLYVNYDNSKKPNTSVKVIKAKIHELNEIKQFFYNKGLIRNCETILKSYIPYLTPRQGDLIKYIDGVFDNYTDDDEDLKKVVDDVKSIIHAVRRNFYKIGDNNDQIYKFSGGKTIEEYIYSGFIKMWKNLLELGNTEVVDKDGKVIGGFIKDGKPLKEPVDDNGNVIGKVNKNNKDQIVDENGNVVGLVRVNKNRYNKMIPGIYEELYKRCFNGIFDIERKKNEFSITDGDALNVIKTFVDRITGMVDKLTEKLNNPEYIRNPQDKDERYENLILRNLENIIRSKSYGSGNPKQGSYVNGAANLDTVRSSTKVFTKLFKSYFDRNPKDAKKFFDDLVNENPDVKKYLKLEDSELLEKLENYSEDKDSSVTESIINDIKFLNTLYESQVNNGVNNLLVSDKGNTEFMYANHSCILPMAGTPILEDMTNEVLNQKLFDGTDLRSDVCDALLKIAKKFKKSLNLPFEPIDVYLTGSSANYNYNDSSDIDLHLVYDFEDVGVNAELMSNLVKYAKNNFNNKYKITIKDIPVELGCENVNNPLVSGGVYSLISKSWIKQPTDKAVEYEDIDDEYYNEVVNLINKCINSDNVSDLENISKFLSSLRKSSLEDDGEFAKGNLLFKKLRSNGLIDELKSKIYDLESNELSLESSEDINNAQ